VYKTVHVRRTLLYNKQDYEELVSKLKEWESFRGNLFIGCAGERLIGYGHLVRWKDKHKFRNGITEIQADSILRSDINYFIKYSYKKTGFSGKKLLAVSSLVFNSGTAKFTRSKLYKYMMCNNDSTGMTWLSWCKYKNNKKWVTSEHLKKRRVWEVETYNSCKTNKNR
jgi:GH24 family phage-related lysozyme (muramidase)